MWPSVPEALANLVIWTDANLSSPKTNKRFMALVPQKIFALCFIIADFSSGL